MRLDDEFTVPAPVERAWPVLLDLERVAPCLPGAAIESRSSGDEYVGTMAVKLGPITARYRGTVRFVEADEAARRSVLRASATDARGEGTAAATITSTLEAVPGGTCVRVSTDLQVTGPVARFGRGVMQDVSAKMMRRFAACLAEEMAAGPAPAPPPRGGERAERAGQAGAPPVAAAPGQELVPSGRMGVLLPPGPAAAAAEAAARGRAPAPMAPGAPSRSPASPPAADDVASRAQPRARSSEDVLDLGEASREAVLERVVPALAALVAAGVAVALLRRRARAGSRSLLTRTLEGAK
jgi:carbon monoxide dehydrogenase subunit G